MKKKLQTKGKDEYEKIREEIKKSSNVPYLNEFSNFDNIDEYMQDIIYLNIYKQRFIYFYAMTRYKLSNEISKENSDVVSRPNKINNKREKEKRDNYLNEAIKYYNECKNINKLFGINQIKIIYSLIMISKCYLSLRDYKNSIININEALYSYYQFSKTFNENHSMKYNPKVMLFVETNIFQYIFFTMAHISYIFHKPSVNNWIILKIFDTSPFILNNVHHQAGINIINFLERNKTKMNKYNKNFLQNKNWMNEYDKLKKKLIKFFSRLSEKNEKEKYKKEGSLITGGDINTRSIHSRSINKKTAKENTMSVKFSSNINASKYKSVYNISRNRRLKKNITICVNENILEKIKWGQFKDIIIKYLNKYFTINEDDKFGYVQFGVNGIIIKSFLSLPLNQFIPKFNKIINNKELNNYSIVEKESQIFIGIYDIFDSIINNYKKTEENDNIIMFFIDEKDIRFSSVADCLNIVDALNENNTSVFFFSFNKIIDEKKVNNIQSFLNGLIEGYFFQIKNYQQLKEIFVNLSTLKYQISFFKYDYDCFDHNI